MPQAQDPMALISELVKTLNLYINVGITHHSNMNNNSKTKVASKRLWMQKGSIQLSLSDMVLVLHLKILCDHFLMFLFSFVFRICIALHSCILYQVVFVCFSNIYIYILKKMEREMWKDVFCITYHGCVVKVDHIIYV